MVVITDDNITDILCILQFCVLTTYSEKSDL